VAWTSRVGDYASELRKLGRTQFLSAYPTPVLVHHFGRAAEAVAARKRTLTTEAKFRTQGRPGVANGAAVLAGDRSDLEARVHPIKKRPGNPYPDTVTMGRADSNDIVVAYDNLSKLHAYFTRSPAGGLLVADAGSTNGTWLAGERLAPNESVKVAERDQLALGEHTFEIFMPTALADWLATFAPSAG
jgi:hypothetical protein